MKYRKLRIAFSSLCAVIFVSLIALWVHSHYWYLYVSKRLAIGSVSLEAGNGTLNIWTMSESVANLSSVAGWSFGHQPLAEYTFAEMARDESSKVEFFGFRYVEMPAIGRSMFSIPFWTILLPIAAATLFPWIKWQIGWCIAISAACVLATVVLIAFWNRSYKWTDITDRSSAINICSMNGQLFFGEAFMVFGTETLNSHPPIPDGHLGICSLRRDEFDLAPLHSGIAIPYWLVVLLSTPIAAVPWLLRFRFSLRTVLIATALAAVVLTVVAFAMK